MKEILARFLGKELVLHYGTSSTVKGKLTDIADGVAQLEGEEATVYLAIDKINLFWEEKPREKPLGFITK
ncbi:MAG: hypothetical protein HY650_16830 [Acidobacteria bacterium]|nr:hypothetical protein [Acidobacteriota bacterium]